MSNYAIIMIQETNHTVSASTLHSQIIIHTIYTIPEYRRYICMLLYVLFQIFIGRSDILDIIRSYVVSNDRMPLVLHGDSGSGKTATIAMAASKVQYSLVLGYFPLVISPWRVPFYDPV